MQIDNANDLDVVMLMYNLIEYSDSYSKTLSSLYIFCRDEPNTTITNSESFKFKGRITERTPAVSNRKYVKIVVSLKYLSFFWRTLEMPLINCEFNLLLFWSASCVITNSTAVVCSSSDFLG